MTPQHYAAEFYRQRGSVPSCEERELLVRIIEEAMEAARGPVGNAVETLGSTCE